MELAVNRQGRRAIEPLAARKRFGKFAPEKEEAVREVHVKESENLLQLKQAWSTYLYSPWGGPSMAYHGIERTIQTINYDSNDVEKFSIMLAEFQEEQNFSSKAGMFLSALVNEGKDDYYVVHTSHLQPKLHHLATYNRKVLVVKGDVGDHAAEQMDGILVVDGNIGKHACNFMRNGYVLIKGNAEPYIGNYLGGGEIEILGDAECIIGQHMRRGLITVHGSGGYFVGPDLGGGKIIVNGPVLCNIGDRMKGGEIHLNGIVSNLINPEEVKGGKIYYKGELIVDK